MHLTELFIRRPVLACVISALVLVFGLRAEQSLPVRQFPLYGVGNDRHPDLRTTAPIRPPSLGFITTPLEGAIAQTQGIDYMTSSSTTSLSDITIHLLLNYDPARALAEVQSYVTSVTSQLPAGVQASSITLSAGGGEVMDLDASSDVLTPAQVGDYIHRLVAPRLQAVRRRAAGRGPGQSERGDARVARSAEAGGLRPDRSRRAECSGRQQLRLRRRQYTLGGMTEVTLDINSGLHSARRVPFPGGAPEGQPHHPAG